MNKQQQELYDKLLKKVNEYCLGQAAEDVIAAIDALVDDYEEDISFATLYSDVFAIIKKQIHSLGIYKGNFYFDGERISKEEYELLKEVLK